MVAEVHGTAHPMSLSSAKPASTCACSCSPAAPVSRVWGVSQGSSQQKPGSVGLCADSAALRLAARACQCVVPGSCAWSRLSQSKDLPVLVVGVWQLFGSCLVAVWLPCASAVVV
ncbi:hypothetical protein I7I51_08544 [Histoplasma capsulatum]|uniref:Uncharacterized protein n=1 Tax=Ajellomyces capsulatus TaxID=5037 RepID=A0A8A1M3T8_AJECA|nr:hypothetical protein I7I51_08544 [Histoplasma capsulatum]